MGRFDVLYNEVNNLNDYELKIIAEKILGLLQQTERTTESYCNSEVIACRKCESNQVARFGKDKNGKQRYRCRACGCTFTSTSFSAFSHSHYSTDVWKKYIRLLLLRSSLEKCAVECGISVRTAFVWRHKILSLLHRDQDNRIMNGIVETDDMFFSVSYKGNHTKSKKFVMPRPSYKRGTDNTAASGSKACVMCAVERKGNVYGEVLGIGAVNEAMLDHAFKNRLSDETIVVCDKAHSIKKYFDQTNIEFIQTAANSIPKRRSSPPEIKGVYHLQNVNNLHKRFRQFMRNYNGVATKYLNNYVNLYIWFENHKKIKNVDFVKELYVSIGLSGSYSRAEDISNLPPIPFVA